LPYELQRWAERAKGERQVKLTVGRTENKKEDSPVNLELTWDDRFRYASEMPLGLSSPMSIPELGIAYQIETTIEAIVPGSPATKATRKPGEPFVSNKGDVITEVRFFETNKDGSVGEPARKPIPLEQHQWAHIAARLNMDGVESKQLLLKVERGAGTNKT